MIEANNVALTYRDGTLALKEVNLSIRQGELVYVTGPSGSGKTSLLKLLMGMEFPTTGTLSVMGVPMEKGRSGKIQGLRRMVGPIFQEFRLIEGRSAMENVMSGMRFLGIPPKQMRRTARETLERVGLEQKLDTRIENLSWGEAQRVAIARAVARKPALILADEPTGNLDQKNAVNILRLLNSFRDHDTTVIITTHATHLVEALDYVTLIHVADGEITVERRE